MKCLSNAFLMLYGCFLIVNRSQATESVSFGRRLYLEGHVETDPLLDLPQPQDLLHLRYRMRLHGLPVLVVHHGRLLPPEKRAQIARLRPADGERVGDQQAKGGGVRR